MCNSLILSWEILSRFANSLRETRKVTFWCADLPHPLFPKMLQKMEFSIRSALNSCFQHCDQQHRWWHTDLFDKLSGPEIPPLTTLENSHGDLEWLENSHNDFLHVWFELRDWIPSTGSEFLCIVIVCFITNFWKGIGYNLNQRYSGVVLNWFTKNIWIMISRCEVIFPQ